MDTYVIQNGFNNKSFDRKGKMITFVTVIVMPLEKGRLKKQSAILFG